MQRCLLYGSYGFTGSLIADLAKAEGAAPILAGRNAEKVKAQAERLGFEHRSFALDDPAEVDAGLADVDVVLHCAGPFSRTSRPMVDACLRTNTHYLDITGEADVFEACAGRDGEATEAGVMVMPGVGFDVVPSDCLAAHLKRRLPDATHLKLAFMPMGGGMSHGTATTMVENLGRPNFVRRDGQLVPVRQGKLQLDVDFGTGPRRCLGIPWGDISTAYRSTGIPNIEVYVGVPRSMIRGAWWGGWMGPLMRTSFVRKMAQKRVDAAPAGPSAEERTAGHTLLWGEARAGDDAVQTRLRTPEGYDLTARTAWDVAKRCVAGEAKAGFQTPSMAFGADYVTTFEGVERTDADAQG